MNKNNKKEKEEEIKIKIEKDDRYEKTKEYWESCDSTIANMLGGNPEINPIDIKASKELITNLIKTNKLHPGRVIDCGAGIGRITDTVLKYYFNEIDLVEMNKKFVDYSIDYFSEVEKVKNCYCSALQFFNFEKTYDCIWVQWCLENLEDEELDIFLTNCYKNLENKGLMIIKENITSRGTFDSNKDFSKIRSDKLFKNFFEKNGFKIFKHFHHPNWPKDFMKVSVFVLRK
jgi:protein N-terminal methyltransferase